jgi:hypothetical protein
LVRDECGFAHADRRVAEIVRHLPSLLGFSRGLASYPPEIEDERAAAHLFWSAGFGIAGLPGAQVRVAPEP